MRQLKISKQSYVKCVSFSNNTRIDIIRALQLNKHMNIRLRHESLNNVKILDKAVFNEKTQMVVEGSMEMKKDGVPMFMGVEQGSGKNQTNVYAWFKPNRVTEAKKWIRKNFGTTFVIAGKKEHVTTLPKINKE